MWRKEHILTGYFLTLVLLSCLDAVSDRGGTKKGDYYTALLSGEPVVLAVFEKYVIVKYNTCI